MDKSTIEKIVVWALDLLFAAFLLSGVGILVLVVVDMFRGLVLGLR